MTQIMLLDQPAEVAEARIGQTEEEKKRIKKINDLYRELRNLMTSRNLLTSQNISDIAGSIREDFKQLGHTPDEGFERCVRLVRKEAAILRTLAYMAS